MPDFEAFYRTHLRLVLGVALARNLCRDRAEDLAQETFFRAWRHFDRLEPMEPPAQRAWLVRTLSNLSVDQWRRDHASETFPLTESVTAPFPTETVALRLDILKALDSLEETDRIVAVLRYLLERNSREIGEMLGMPESSVRFRLVKCRRHLAERLIAWRSGEKHNGER